MGLELLLGIVLSIVLCVSGARKALDRAPDCPLPTLGKRVVGTLEIVGAIGLWVAQAAAAAGTSTRVLGIEANPAAAADAAANAAANGLDAAQYSVARGRAEDHIATLEQRPPLSSTKRATARRSTCAARGEQKACGLLCSRRRAAVSPRQRPARGCWRPLARWQEAGALPPPCPPPLLLSRRP